MLFNSFQFWAFLLVVGVVYWRLPHRAQNVFLLAASYFFYGSWDWRFLSLILTSTTLDFFVARAIAASTTQAARRRYLLLSLGVNLGILGVFKYYGFFSTELTRLLDVLGIPSSIPLIHIILPVGISFYTFQALSYTIDVYRGEMRPTNRFVDFALYISFFPQLVAGPIERSSRLLPQVANPRTVTRGDFSDGLHLVLLGLFKKVVIADNMAPIVNSIFSRDVSQLSGAECLMGVYAFAFQIYGDFSGYSAIAKGVAKWLGFDLMTNFSAPYLATSPQDFWRRWHISLSTWLRDYLYIPLGGNRGGKLFIYRNLLLTMLLGGLWHGAAWTFIAWGAFHGALLAAHRYLSERRPARHSVASGSPIALASISNTAKVLGTFHLVCFGWLLFRAESIGQAGSMMYAIVGRFHWTELSSSILAMTALLTVPVLLYESWLHPNGDRSVRRPPHWLSRGMVYSYCSLMLLFFPAPFGHDFIYFQF